ncbi:ethyl tert-butyl ether degradation protein EthD [Variovorax sp. WS11]|uniref:EthD domain-containing protein n=1 Tax=Variovorax sp. WS11 TaxID=1105204 RepID=UPI000D0D3498|nr:EthD family reductase [Variovorax sp. WS11]NDZ18070.1 EthD family reductase [Variovorax sp. WS11]PSL79998.1 ethyl tert-butyl ether degradation protein EthD [Variovorax sp. WS11]
MNVRMGLIRKKADWTFEDFNAYWRDRHGPLAARAPHLREYWQNPVVDRVQRGIDFVRGPWDFDGISQLWFDDARQSQRAFGDGDLAAALIKDENHFLGGLHIVTAEQSVVIPPPAKDERAKLLKRISVIKRLPALSEEDFRREWRVHGDLVRQMPGVSAYRQNVVTAREREKGQPCDYDTLPIDGIVELWFKDTRTLQEAFASRAGHNTMAHAKTFLGEITAFLVDERRIV